MRSALLFISAFAFLITNNLWAEWSSLGGSSSKINQIVVYDEKVFVATYGEGVQYFDYFDEEWNESSDGLTNLIITDLLLIDQSLFAATEGAGVFNSITRGKSWTSISSTIGNLNCYSMTAIDNKLYVATDNFGIYKTEDLGNAWTNINSNMVIENNIWTISSFGEKIYAGTQFGKFFVTADDGENWTSLQSGQMVFNITDIAVYDQWIIVGTQGGGLFISVDGGLNWENKKNGLTNFNVTDVIIDKDYRIFVATKGGVFFSDNNGQTFVAINQGIGNFDITALYADDTYIYAGSNGSGIYRRLLSDIQQQEVLPPSLVGPVNGKDNISVEKVTLSWEASKGAVSYQIIVALDEAFSQVVSEQDNYNMTVYTLNNLLTDTAYYWKVAANTVASEKKWSETWSFRTEDPSSVFEITSAEKYNFIVAPNPANTITEFSFDVPEASKISIRLYTSDGTLAEEIFNGVADGGRNYFKYDCSDLPSASYFVRVTVGDKYFVQPIMVVH